MRKFVAVFFDDILIYSPNLAVHLGHLQAVLQTLRDNQFLVKKIKCAFGQSSVEHLGHVVSVDGVHMDRNKVQAVLDWPQPKNVKELRGFSGLTGYYRRFVRAYAFLATPLIDLLKTEAFEWSIEAQQAFEQLK